MNYLIRDKSGNYLSFTGNNKWFFSPDSENAARLTEAKAHNFLRSSIPQVKRTECSVVPEISAPTPLRDTETRFDWAELTASQQKLYAQLFSYKEELRTQLSTVDQEICDIEHYIEFFSLDAAKGYKAYKMLRDRLQHRRHIKNELAKVSHMLSGSPENFSSGEVGRRIRGLDHAGYSPRVLGELFGPLGTGDRYFS